MTFRSRASALACIALALGAPLCFADTVIYDDASRNGFDQACSFNGGGGDFDFANVAPVRAGNASIRFTPETFDAVSWCAPATLATSAYSGISLWVNGGATGGQDIELAFALAGAQVAHAALATLHGGALPANTWVHITASFDAAPMAYSGTFDQLWLMSNTGVTQPDVYLDDVGLTARASGADRVFADGFDLPRLRGTNLVGMEMAYFNYDQAIGPIADQHYVAYDTRVIDFYASKHMTQMRLLFSWEGMQAVLNGPLPAAAGGNYKAYFDNYKRVVDYATSLGLEVVVEPWQADAGGGAGGARWRGDLVGSPAVPIAAFADFWTRMAGVFKDNPRVSYGLVNEPNSMSTMTWWSAAQAAVSAIRGTGSVQRIHVPGNGYTAASSWTSNWYDTAAPARSNAYGWLNANGPGQPLLDPLGNSDAEVHTYLDTDQGGGTTEITAVTAARDHLAIAANEAAAHGYRIYVGEIGFYAGNPLAAAAWADFIGYVDANPATIAGFTWWAGGMPGWWDDVGANGGGHFSITPTNAATFTGDTVNMSMIEGDF